jgi:hypothetical protein
MQNFDYLTVQKADWEVTSYGDFGAYTGYGGTIRHMKFRSPKLGHGTHTIMLQVGFGAELEISAEILTFINSSVQNLIKAKDGATAESNYKKVKCMTAFSIADIIGSTVVSFSEAMAFGVGLKVGALRVDSAGGPAGPGHLFTIPAAVENEFGFGAGMSAQGGVIIGVGLQYWDYNMQQKFERELRRKPTDPVIMDAAK